MYFYRGEHLQRASLDSGTSRLLEEGVDALLSVGSKTCVLVWRRICSFRPAKLDVTEMKRSRHSFKLRGMQKDQF